MHRWKGLGVRTSKMPSHCEFAVLLVDIQSRPLVLPGSWVKYPGSWQWRKLGIYIYTCIYIYVYIYIHIYTYTNFSFSYVFGRYFGPWTVQKAAGDSKEKFPPSGVQIRVILYELCSKNQKSYFKIANNRPWGANNESPGWSWWSWYWFL